MFRWFLRLCITVDNGIVKRFERFGVSLMTVTVKRCNCSESGPNLLAGARSQAPGRAAATLCTPLWTQPVDNSLRLAE